jgi:hypothetical protein
MKKKYVVYKEQRVTEFLGVFEFDGNIHDAKHAAGKFFKVQSSVVYLCEECKKNAVFTSRPYIQLNEIKERGSDNG